MFSNTDHPGSIVGFADSNSSQKLLISSNPNPGSADSATAVTIVSPGSLTSDSSSGNHHYTARKDKMQQSSYPSKHHSGRNDYQGKISFCTNYDHFDSLNCAVRKEEKEKGDELRGREREKNKFQVV